MLHSTILSLVACLSGSIPPALPPAGALGSWPETVMSGDKDHLQSCCPLLTEAATSYAKLPYASCPTSAGEHLLSAMRTNRPPQHPRGCTHATPLLQGERLLTARQAPRARTTSSEYLCFHVCRESGCWQSWSTPTATTQRYAPACPCAALRGGPTTAWTHAASCVWTRQTAAPTPF